MLGYCNTSYTTTVTLCSISILIGRVPIITTRCSETPQARENSEDCGVTGVNLPPLATSHIDGIHTVTTWDNTCRRGSTRKDPIDWSGPIGSSWLWGGSASLQYTKWPIPTPSSPTFQPSRRVYPAKAPRPSGRWGVVNSCPGRWKLLISYSFRPSPQVSLQSRGDIQRFFNNENNCFSCLGMREYQYVIDKFKESCNLRAYSRVWLITNRQDYFLGLCSEGLCWRLDVAVRDPQGTETEVNTGSKSCRTFG